MIQQSRFAGTSVTKDLFLRGSSVCPSVLSFRPVPPCPDPAEMKPENRVCRNSGLRGRVSPYVSLHLLTKFKIRQKGIERFRGKVVVVNSVQSRINKYVGPEF